MKEFEEKRRFPRMKANCAMSYKRVAAGNQAHALCMEISASGIMFEADEAVEPGRALEIRTFPADRITPPITALIEVTRCTSAGLERYRIAGVIKGIKSQAPEPAAS
ncbi:MAG: PilZ domain-containing protein [Candidatus Methylumidiphilus sp.]